MSNPLPRPASRERDVAVTSGWLMLPIVLVLLAAGLSATIHGASNGNPPVAMLGIVLLVAFFISLAGFFTLQPNEARVLVLFGDYKGTVRKEGFHFGNPFYSNGGGAQATITEGGKTTVTPKKNPRMKISLRSRNLNGERLKVNDKQGNPIEIAAVVVWRVQDTAQAMFDVDDYEEYVHIQSESAVRHLGSQYAYDHGEEHEITLRSGVDEVSEALQAELQTRLAPAGVVVEEARLTHLAYAPEVAQAMLRRQQAEAVLAARQKIVQGAVSMVEMALTDLARRGVVDLDAERKAAMVSNLMVVLCGDSEAKPVINTGTLYG
ncbi:MAG: SPFH domain-containing protein [Gammaproteobacteria bacterium]|jgi:regulator of protease activity HflC (stomatin/prohibitin superfamily)